MLPHNLLMKGSKKRKNEARAGYGSKAPSKTAKLTQLAAIALMQNVRTKGRYVLVDSQLSLFTV